MKCLSKLDLLAKQDLPVRAVPLPADTYGEDAGVFVRTLTGAERSRFESLFPDGAAARKEPGRFRATLVVLTACDADGKRLFEDADAPLLMDKSSLMIERLFDAALAHNKLSGESIEDAEKN